MGSYTQGLFKKGRTKPSVAKKGKRPGWDPRHLDQPLKKDKGEYDGSCNRQACQDPGATWYNHGTQKYYCWRCARDLNTDPFNRRDAERLFGHPLCTQGRYEDFAKQEEERQSLKDLIMNPEVEIQRRV